jgi:hypothetical protein
MMSQNNNLSVLPFYTDINEQNHRKSYAYGEVYPLFAQAGILLPFQIFRPHRLDGVMQVRLFRMDGTPIADLTRSMTELGMQVVPFTAYGYDVILYPAIFPISQLTMLDGQHYLTLYDGEDMWYSEVFTLVQDMSPYLKIEWYNDENLVFGGGQQFVFNNPRFHNYLYFATEVGKPEYTFEEEGEKRDGYFFPTKQLSEKVYKCTVLAPEYLCDVMRLIRMCDHVRITDKYGRVYDCDTFLITPDWKDQGDIASVEIEFETDTVVKKIGKGYMMSTADFNDDYNNDYLIEETT